MSYGVPYILEELTLREGAIIAQLCLPCVGGNPSSLYLARVFFVCRRREQSLVHKGEIGQLFSTQISDQGDVTHQALLISQDQAHVQGRHIHLDRHRVSESLLVPPPLRVCA